MIIELNTSYAEKDIVKSYGAKWEPNSKKWYLESQNIAELSDKLDMIAKDLGKKVENIAPKLSKELVKVPTNTEIQNDAMSPKEYIEKLYSMMRMVDGCFTEEKPEDSKTIVGWLKEGFIPISVDAVKTYKFSEDKGYQYVAKSNTREMAEEEKSAFEEVMSERKKKSIEKAAQKRTEKKAEEDAEKGPVRNRQDAIKSFLTFKGLTKEFDSYYDEYCKNNPVETAQKSEKSQKSRNNKKIKHLPDYSAIQGKKILCFDTETTGFSPDKGDELLQVAFVSLDNGKIQTLFQSLIKPHEKTSWVGAMIKNHISPKMVEKAPYPEDIKNQVQEIVDQADVIVGYNIDFDINFLEKCMGIDFSNKIVADPGDYFRQNKPDSSSFNLEACVTNYCNLEDLNEYKADAHKADTDAIATLKAFCAQSKLEGYSLLSYEEEMEEEIER